MTDSRGIGELRLVSRTFPKLGKIYAHETRELRFIYREIFENREYLRYGLRLWPGAVIFDVGAHVGLFVLFAWQECQQDATIFAFEPLPCSHACLLRNLAERGLDGTPQIRVINAGLTRSAGQDHGSFVYYKHVPGNSSMRPHEVEAIWSKNDAHSVQQALSSVSPILAGLFRFLPFKTRLIKRITRRVLRGQEIYCPLSTLSEMWRRFGLSHIDFLKIDAEGSELEILEGVDDLHWQRIGQVAIEVFDIDSRVDTIVNRLRQQGFPQVEVARAGFASDTTLDVHMIYARRACGAAAPHQRTERPSSPSRRHRSG